LEGGAIFAGNFGNLVLNSSVRTRAQILNNAFENNRIVGVPAGSDSPLFNFNDTAVFFSSGSSTVTTMAPGGGAIAVEFSGDAKIYGNTFTGNTALRKPQEEAYRGGAILVGGTAGTPIGMDLAHACLTLNLSANNRADIGDYIALYNPANIPGGVTIDACPSALKK